ncbi:MAG TPA: hypothetical protein VFD94_02260, partial [Jatrophihabitans sp.]|nr:hypothetical protein [Jatrophihabitans sp.]
SATQILASGLAAVSATVAASYFGVAGTVIGAGLGSVISVVGSAVYSYSIRRTHSRVRQGLDVAVAQRFSVKPRVPFAAGLRSGLSPRRLSLAAAGLFLLVLAATTGFELASGQPLAATVSGKHGSGTSLDGGRTSRPSAPASRQPAGSSSGARSTVTVTVPASSTGSPSSGVPTSSPPSSNPASSSPPSSPPSSSSGASSAPTG